jgi:hypothetical protein
MKFAGLFCLETACRFCDKPVETDECKECEEYFKSQGHHPKKIRHYQVPGSPWVVVRYCGESSPARNCASRDREVVNSQALIQLGVSQEDPTCRPVP